MKVDWICSYLMTDVVIIFNSLITIAYLDVMFSSLGVCLELQQHGFLRRLDERPHLHLLTAGPTAFKPRPRLLLCPFNYYVNVHILDPFSCKLLLVFSPHAINQTDIFTGLLQYNLTMLIVQDGLVTSSCQSWKFSFVKMDANFYSTIVILLLVWHATVSACLVPLLMYCSSVQSFSFLVIV